MEPTPTRPRLPRGYGVESATSPPGERFPWRRVEELLTGSRNYWICTTCPDGRPHAKPVWGLWLSGRLLFSTHHDTVTGRNLDGDAPVVAHLESGDEVVIVHGTSSRIGDAALLAEFGREYARKYEWPLRPEELVPENPGMGFYAVEPSSVLSWNGALDIAETITSWSFE